MAKAAALEGGRGTPIVEEIDPMGGIPDVPDMRLELVPVPVSDVERAKAFYQQVGFGNVIDVQVTDTMRVVQLTPPGSSCAIVFGTGMGPITEMAPGSVKGLHLVVEDMVATRAALTARGIELSDVEDMGGVLYSYFSDPDGNLWALQQWSAGNQA
jgi:predicted lactoylglutathione lyase